MSTLQPILHDVFKSAFHDCQWQITGIPIALGGVRYGTFIHEFAKVVFALFLQFFFSHFSQQE